MDPIELPEYALYYCVAFLLSVIINPFLAYYFYKANQRVIAVLWIIPTSILLISFILYVMIKVSIRYFDLTLLVLAGTMIGQMILGSIWLLLEKAGKHK